ncbi:lipopolysaccharide biosynthesis protein [Halopiger djelfimassiliensis]|uniref:lipopolysaccharide biosynthesis protein n=1 Tax=Halopiger djelfimassiliensis TaxID=1293047 RepID=UPI0006782527|nr:oligosaccharide flippase family protein [Halopiger djelfimassiliensis]
MVDASSVSLGGETVKATAAKFAMAAVGFVGVVLFARILGPTAFGGFYLLLALVKLADRVAVGWGIAIKKRFSEAGAPERELLGAQALFTVAWIAIAGVATVLGARWLVSYTGLAAAPVLFVVVLLSTTLYEPVDRVVQARGLVGASMWVDTLRSILTFPLQLGLVLLGLGAAGMAYGLAGATFLTVPVLWYYVRVVPTLPPRDTLSNLGEYARFSVPNAVLGQAYDRFDVLLLGYLLTPAAAGYYEVALKITLPATFVSMAAASGLMARVSHRHSMDADVSEDVSNTVAFASVIAIPLFLGALALRESLVVTLFGPEYAEAAALLVGLALYKVVRTQSVPLLRVIDGIDRPEINTAAASGTLAINVVLGVVLTLSYGPIGVVVATVVAESIRYAVAAIVVKRHLPDVSLLPRTLLEQVAAAAVMFAVVVLAARVIAIEGWSHLLAIVTLGAAVYAGTLWALSSKLRVTVGGVVRGTGLEF